MFQEQEVDILVCWENNQKACSANLVLKYIYPIENIKKIKVVPPLKYSFEVTINFWNPAKIPKTLVNNVIDKNVIE